MQAVQWGRLVATSRATLRDYRLREASNLSNHTALHREDRALHFNQLCAGRYDALTPSGPAPLGLGPWRLQGRPPHPTPLYGCTR